jgi:hypothetical protein
VKVRGGVGGPEGRGVAGTVGVAGGVGVGGPKPLGGGGGKLTAVGGGAIELEVAGTVGAGWVTVGNALGDGV